MCWQLCRAVRKCWQTSLPLFMWNYNKNTKLVLLLLLQRVSHFVNELADVVARTEVGVAAVVVVINFWVVNVCAVVVVGFSALPLSLLALDMELVGVFEWAVLLITDITVVSCWHTPDLPRRNLPSFSSFLRINMNLNMHARPRRTHKFIKFIARVRDRRDLPNRQTKRRRTRTITSAVLTNALILIFAFAFIRCRLQRRSWPN